MSHWSQTGFFQYVGGSLIPGYLHTDDHSFGVSSNICKQVNAGVVMNRTNNSLGVTAMKNTTFGPGSLLGLPVSADCSEAYTTFCGDGYCRRMAPAAHRLHAAVNPDDVLPYTKLAVAVIPERVTNT